jgi:hypothetical protein
MAKKQKPRYTTFRLMDRTGTIKSPLLVVGDSFESYRVVYQDRELFKNKVCDGTVLYAHIAENHEASHKANTIYYKQASAPELLASLFNSIRATAVEEAATPEAIRLLGELSPWSEKEKKIMAEKLKAKASAAKPDKAGLKSAAKSAPVAKNATADAPKKRGNADALAKARAARASGPDTRRITSLKKAKDIAARAGSYRHGMLTDLLASKTVQEFRDKNKSYSAGDLRYAQEAGYISLPAK